MVVALVAVVVFGLLHGIEPAHGWPIAMFYAASKKRPMLHGLVSSSLMAGAHFTSSIFAVVAYLVLRHFVSFPLNILKYAAAGLLLVLAVRFWFETTMETQHGHIHDVLERLEHSHEHTHEGSGPHTHEHTHEARAMNLRGLAGLAFVLGFAHEEAFALLALAVVVDPVLVIVSYSLAVTASLIAVTLLCVRAYARFRGKLHALERFAPRLTALILIALAGAFLLNIA